MKALPIVSVGIALQILVVIAASRREACGLRENFAQTANGFCTFRYKKLTAGMEPRAVAQDSEGDIYVVDREYHRILVLWPPPDAAKKEADVNWKILFAGLELNHAIVIDQRDPDGPFIYASSSNDVWRWKFKPGSRNTLGTPTKIIAEMPDGGDIGPNGAPLRNGHSSRSLLFDRLGNLYVQLGSERNVDKTKQRTKIKKFSVELIRNGPYPILFSDKGQVHASGLRNSAGLDVDARNVLWGTNSGSDNLKRGGGLGGDITEDNPCEEINRLAVSGRFYGFPYCWAEGKLPMNGRGPGTHWAYNETYLDGFKPTDTWCRNEQNVERPKYCLTAHSTPLGFKFVRQEHLNKRFSLPNTWLGDMIVLQKGSWNRKVPSGHTVARVDFDRPGGQPTMGKGYSVLVNGQPNTKHLLRPVEGIFLKDGSFLFSSDITNELIVLRHYTS